MQKWMRDGIKETVDDAIGISLTAAQVELIFDNDKSLAKELRQFRGHWDTVCREMIMDTLARHVVGRNWPTYKEGVRVQKNFLRDFYTKAHEMGLTISSASLKENHVKGRK